MSDELRERLAEVLTRHEDTGYNPDTGQWRCDCGATLPPDGSMATYWYHLADELLPLVRAERDKARAEGRTKQLTREERRDLGVVFGYEAGLAAGRAEVVERVEAVGTFDAYMTVAPMVRVRVMHDRDVRAALDGTSPGGPR